MPKLLAEAEEQLLWKSIQDESGEDSLWLTHFEEAAAIFRRELIAIGNLHPPTSSQLRGWLERSAARHADPPCRTRDLLTRGPKSCNIHRAGADVTGKVPENPTSIQSPHPSPAGQPKNSSQHRQKKAERRSRHQAAVNKIGNEGLVFQSPEEDNRERLVSSAHQSFQTSSSQQVANLQLYPPHHPLEVVSPNEKASDRTHVNLEILLGQDPRSYLPKNGQLRSLRDEIIAKISLAVRTWLAATDSSQPQFFEAVRDPASYHLLKRIYGISNKELMLDKITSMSLQQPIDIETVLQAFIGRAVHEWVLEAQHRSLDPAEDETQLYSAPEDMRNGFPALLQLQSIGCHSMLLQQLSEISPQIREQLERKSRFEYVQRTEDVNAPAGEMANRLSLALRTFHNATRWSIEAVDAWSRHLRGAFGAAIRLKLLTCLQPNAFFFRFPQMEDVFESSWMQNHMQNPTNAASSVYLAMFPAMFRTEEVMARDLDQMEPPVFPAVVIRASL
ncbi:MAG: hypothetical protein LQ337_007460 [Flavoplaca oasis]|nr:MAG: hypothetical protein LQ337_007460 [Flavoplaca oasis]